ncbi:MAG: STAS/SEC14 domain-containing protein [Deltaproteobacteria bacterium]|nr:STAS/SEC14 domain-containing protein [Deltaproteobacteria bacterium]
MLETLKNLPPGIVGLKATGKVTTEDYERVFEPLVHGARREGRRLRFLYHLGPEFEGFTPGAAREDAELGLRSIRLFDRCAIVSDLGWVRESTRLIGFLMPCPVQVFANRERDDAVEWLRALPEGGAASRRFLPELGVIVVEIKEALRVQDFDALALTAHTWIEVHGDLQGVVLHARRFPGWENFGSLLRHVQFVRDHHRKVKKVALSADSKLASLVTRLGDHFAKAEVKTFAYDELESAVEWAGTRDSVTVPTQAHGEAR